jgi:uncharacterized membrane protein YhaH (DUF805 family)
MKSGLTWILSSFFAFVGSAASLVYLWDQDILPHNLIIALAVLAFLVLTAVDLLGIRRIRDVRRSALDAPRDRFEQELTALRERPVAQRQTLRGKVRDKPSGPG